MLNLRNTVLKIWFFVITKSQIEENLIKVLFLPSKQYTYIDTQG